MKEGYKSVLESEKIVISKQGEEIATRTLCANTDMIILGESDKAVVNDKCNSASKPRDGSGKNFLNLHDILGHCAKDTVMLTFGLQEHHTDHPDCTICAITKSRQRNIPTIASNTALVLLEIIELDLQGPFPVTGANGTRMNLKMIDSFSGYVIQFNP